MSEDKLVTCAIDTSPEEKWGTPEDGLADLKNNMIILMSNYVSFMWQVGQYAAWVQEMANYGDGAIEKLCEELRHKKTWVYSCINMHKMYPWEVIEQKFIAAGVPATSIARLASSDDSLYDLSLDRIVNMGVKLKKLGIQIDNVVDTVSKHRPSEFED
jgi:hypothetical protein